MPSIFQNYPNLLGAGSLLGLAILEAPQIKEDPLLMQGKIAAYR